jgi:hypothetical protein
VAKGLGGSGRTSCDPSEVSEFGLAGGGFDAESTARLVREAVAIFGVSRVMYGSNLPVSSLSAHLAVIIDAIVEGLDDPDTETIRAVFNDNARGNEMSSLTAVASYQPADDVGNRAYRKATARIVPILLAAFLAAYLDRVNVGFAKLQMVSDLKLSDAVYGLGAGVFFLGYFLFELPSNLILHRVGARAWLARIMITWGLISALTMLVQTEWQFYAMRFALGVAEAGFMPGVIYFLSSWFPAQRRGSVIGLYFIGLGMAGFIGGPVSGLILKQLSGAWG